MAVQADTSVFPRPTEHRKPGGWQTTRPKTQKILRMANCSHKSAWNLCPSKTTHHRKFDKEKSSTMTKVQPTSVLPKSADRIEDYKLILQLMQEKPPVIMAIYTKDYSWSAHMINQTISTLQKLIPAFRVEMLLSYDWILILASFLRSTSSLYTAIQGESVKIWVWTQFLTAVFCYLSTFKHQNHCTAQTVVESKLLHEKMSQLEMSKSATASVRCYS